MKAAAMRAATWVLLAVAALAAVPAIAAEYRPPRNAAGQPDLQGVWNTHFILPMEARPDTPSLTLREAEAKAFAQKLNAEAGALAIFAQDREVAEIRQEDYRSAP